MKVLIADSDAPRTERSLGLACKSGLTEFLKILSIALAHSQNPSVSILIHV